MLIAFLALRVQLHKLCESVLAQQFTASPALLLCDIRPLLRSQSTRSLKSCSGSLQKPDYLAVKDTRKPRPPRPRLLGNIGTDRTI